MSKLKPCDRNPYSTRIGGSENFIINMNGVLLCSICACKVSEHSNADKSVESLESK